MNKQNKFAHDYLEILDSIAGQFEHCLTVSAIDQPDQPIVYASASFEQHTGHPRSAAIGNNLRFLQGTLDSQPARETMRNAIAAGRAVFTDVINFTCKDVPYVNRLVLLPFNYISTANDRYYLGLQRMIGSPDEVSRARAEPKSGEIEHHINNPLTVALGVAELKLGHADEVDKAIARIERYIDNL